MVKIDLFLVLLFPAALNALYVREFWVTKNSRMVTISILVQYLITVLQIWSLLNK